MLRLRMTYETRVYVNEEGSVTILQSSPLGDEDSVVVLAADQLEYVITELQALLDDRKSWEPDPFADGPDISAKTD